jgi:hypothetical protein
MDGLFFHKPIMVHLGHYLSVEDLFALSTLNKRMYYEWIRRLDVLDMRRLVKERFGWHVAKANPFVYVRKYMRQYRRPFNGVKFRCTGGCGETQRYLANAYFSKYAICQKCVSKRYNCHTYTQVLYTRFMSFDKFEIDMQFRRLLRQVTDEWPYYFGIDEKWFKQRAQHPLLYNDEGDPCIEFAEVKQQFMLQVQEKIRQNGQDIKELAARKGLRVLHWKNRIQLGDNQFFSYFSDNLVSLLYASQQAAHWLLKRRKTSE